MVRHAGHSITYDWGTSVAGEIDAVHWAAFYSDCEHEVREVSQGHRVTLTYSLYYAPGVSDLARCAPAMQATALPLYRKVERVLADATFMPKGGVLGVCCRHGYAHSSRSAGKALPAVLKGVDMAVYAVFRAHGLDVQVRPVADRVVDDFEFDLDPKYQSDNPGFNTRAGTLGQLEASDVGGHDDATWDEIWADWSHDQLDVHWLTQPVLRDDQKEPSFIHMLVCALLSPSPACCMLTECPMVVRKSTCH